MLHILLGRKNVTHSSECYDAAGVLQPTDLEQQREPEIRRWYCLQWWQIPSCPDQQGCFEYKQDLCQSIEMTRKKIVLALADLSESMTSTT